MSRPIGRVLFTPIAVNHAIHDFPSPLVVRALPYTDFSPPFPRDTFFTLASPFVRHSLTNLYGQIRAGMKTYFLPLSYEVRQWRV